MKRKYKYYLFDIEPINEKLFGGSDHQITFKAIDFNHALKQAFNYVKFKVDGNRIYHIKRYVKEMKHL